MFIQQLLLFIVLSQDENDDQHFFIGVLRDFFISIQSHDGIIVDLYVLNRAIEQHIYRFHEISNACI